MTSTRQSILRTDTLNEVTAIEITGPSPRRIAILFVPHNTARFSVSPESGVQIDTGLTLQFGGDVIELTVERHGDIVRRGWFAIASAATTKIAWLETFEGD
jgi:hypothetical protein